MGDREPGAEPPTGDGQDKGNPEFNFFNTIDSFESFAREQLAADMPTEPEINKIWQEIEPMQADQKEWASLSKRLIDKMTEHNKSAIVFLFVEVTQHFLNYKELYDQLKSRTMSAVAYLEKMKTAAIERKLLLGQMRRLEETVSKE